MYRTYAFESTDSLLGSVALCLLASGTGCTNLAPGEENGVTIVTFNTQIGSSAVILIHLGQSDSVKGRDLNLLTKTKRNLASVQVAFGQCCYQGKRELGQQNGRYFPSSEMFANTDTMPVNQILEVLEVH